ncbi:MAG: SAM-dependent chlorinase/fluorinase [Holophagales bacterium]|nr:MAG: SAM-dependent chlorinase/fluorinase [Holophagales bacterium]
MPVVTLLTDFGLDDYYVGAVKGTLLDLAPSLILVDLSHTVPPGDVERASFLLAAAAPSFPPGTIHLAVVDPGVGSTRRRLALAAAGHFFVAPDNGLLTPWLASARPRNVVSLPLDRPAPGATFHGRDRFAPLAAAIANGVAFDTLGDEVDDAVRIDRVRPWRGDGELHGQVVHVDRFGNLVSDLPSAWLPFASTFVAEIASDPPLRIEHLAACYADLAPDTAGAIPGSLGTLEFSLRDAPLSGRTTRVRGAAVVVRIR